MKLPAHLFVLPLLFVGLAAGCDSTTHVIDTTPHDLAMPDLATATGTCTDSLKNGSETDVDCGGSCPKCATGLHCKLAADCLNKVCMATVCQSPTCVDGVQNGTESDVDCGGGLCPRCAEGKQCKSSSDCVKLDCGSGSCGGPQDGGMPGVDASTADMTRAPDLAVQHDMAIIGP